MADTVKANLRDILNELRPHLLALAKGNFNRDGMFQCATRAAIVKAFEFSESTQKEHAEPFSMTATLRGICEVLIVLSVMSRFSDKDDILEAINADNIADGLSRQAVFFKFSAHGNQL